MTLRPGCAPARLLLELWQAQANGNRHPFILPGRNRAQLLQLGFIESTAPPSIFTLTPAGRKAAQVLDAGSR